MLRTRWWEMQFVTRPALVFFVLLTVACPAPAAESLDQSINYLIDYIAHSNAIFFRNGVEHTPKQAANHVKAKYVHLKRKIGSPEDFIRLAASKSVLTGKPYLVRTADGREIPLEKWLTTALQEHRAAGP